MPEHDSKEDDASTVVPSIQEVPWTNHTEDQIRQIQHNNSPSHDTHHLEVAIRTLYKYGILILVTFKPIVDGGAGIAEAALASAISGTVHKWSPETHLLAAYQQHRSSLDSSSKQPKSYSNREQMDRR